LALQVDDAKRSHHSLVHADDPELHAHLGHQGRAAPDGEVLAR
jgi:hypothetical protein